MPTMKKPKKWKVTSVFANAPDHVRSWEGMYVRCRFDVANGYMKLPAGTVFKIASAGVLKSLVSSPCPCCGRQMYVRCHQAKKDFLREFDFVQVEEVDDEADADD